MLKGIKAIDNFSSRDHALDQICSEGNWGNLTLRVASPPTSCKTMDPETLRTLYVATVKRLSWNRRILTLLVKSIMGSEIFRLVLFF